MKKITLLILTLISALCFLVACDNNHEHNFSIEWTKTDTHHYHICSCGEKQDYSQHTFDNGRVILTPTETTKGEKLFTCTVCEGTKIEEIPTTGTNPSEPSNPQNPTNPSNPHEHQYTKTVIDNKFLKSEATLSQKAVYFYSCECGAIGEKTFEYGDYAKPTSDVVYDISADNSYAEVVSYTGNSSSVVISDSFNDLPVTKIYDSAFESSSIESIIMPNSITSIGASAFKNCKNLQRIVLSENLIEIGNECFYYCSALTETTFPQSLVTIGSKAFIGCSLIEISIPEKVTNIESHTFSFNKNLKDVDLPNNLLKIDSYAFYSCSKLENIQIPESLKYIGSNAFESCGVLEYNTYERVNYLGNKNNPYLLAIGIEDNIYTSYQLHQNVKLIAPYTFQECRRLSKIIIPESVIYIGNAALYKCTALTDITVPFIGSDILGEESDKFYHIFGYSIPTTLKTIVISNANTISRGALDGCDSLENLTLPFVGETIDSTANTSLGYIFGASSFSSPEEYVPNSLKNVTITKATHIRNSAFSRCANLECVIIGNNVIEIGSSAFYECEKLSNVVLGDSVINIGVSAFSGCKNLNKINLNSIANIRDEAFYNCKELSEVIFGSKLLSIGEYSFAGCSSLINITVPNNVSSIGYNAFKSCSSLKSISLPFIGSSSNDTKNTYLGYIFGEYSSSYIGSTVPPSSLETVVITGSTSINASAFAGCHNLVNITIGDNVTSIGEKAFYACKNLKKVKIGSNVQSVGASAFWDCSNLTDVSFGNGIENIGDSVFLSCKNIKYNEYDNAYYIGNEDNPYLVLIKAKDNNINSCTINSRTKIVYCNAFKDCINLSNISIGENVKKIGHNAFENCSNLEKVTIGESVASIENYAFKGCDKLKINVTDLATWCNIDFTSAYANPLYYTNALYLNDKLITNLTIPNGVTVIKDFAFYNCKGLSTINVPNSVISIGDSAFRGCDATDITLPFVGASNDAQGYKAVFGYVFGWTTYSSIDSLHNSGTYQYQYSSSKYYYYHIPKTLKKVTINSNSAISDGAFRNCIMLTEIVVGNQATSIGSSAFSGCNNLESITIGSNVSLISSNAFNDCKKLTKVVFLDTTTWHTTTSSSNWKNKTGGTQTSVTSSSANATFLKNSSNYKYYWYKV